MRKNILFVMVLCGLFLITGCQDNNSGEDDTKELTYTNKFECTREETLIIRQVYYMTKEDDKNNEDDTKEAIKVKYSKVYDFNKSGDKLLAYRDITTYTYLVDYDMEAQKKYFEDECKNKDKNTYKSCQVSLNDKVITVISEVDLESDTSKEYLSTATLDMIKENYAESSYICK